MKWNGKSLATLGLAALAIFAFVGCSTDEEPESTGIVHQVLDSFTMAVADNMDAANAREAAGDTAADQAELPASDLAVALDNPPPGLPQVNDMLIDSTLVFAVYEGGLLIYDLESREYSMTAVDENLRTLARHAGDLFAGGTGLYQIEGAELIPVEAKFEGEINELYSYGPSLMIGTTNGLYARNILGTINLLEDMDVSSMVEDRFGLWVGTSGQGVYHWDGKRFKKRYLARDESLFDNVTALAFNHDHLYLGTDRGMYVFDGGSWATVSTEEGLPLNLVTSIDASGWVVYVGTPGGLVSYFQREVSPVSQLNDRSVSVVRVDGRRIFAGTGRDGLVLKSGPAVTTLVNPFEEQDGSMASLAH